MFDWISIFVNQESFLKAFNYYFIIIVILVEGRLAVLLAECVVDRLLTIDVMDLCKSIKFFTVRVCQYVVFVKSEGFGGPSRRTDGMPAIFSRFTAIKFLRIV